MQFPCIFPHFAVLFSKRLRAFVVFPVHNLSLSLRAKIFKFVIMSVNFSQSQVRNEGSSQSMKLGQRQGSVRTGHYIFHPDSGPKSSGNGRIGKLKTRCGVEDGAGFSLLPRSQKYIAIISSRWPRSGSRVPPLRCRSRSGYRTTPMTQRGIQGPLGRVRSGLSDWPRFRRGPPSSK
jgi:hypothetical protein